MCSEVFNFTVGQVSDSEDEEESNSGDEETTQTSTEVVTSQVITNESLYASLKGKIILTVETNGEAYYINPQCRHNVKPELTIAVTCRYPAYWLAVD